MRSNYFGEILGNTKSRAAYFAVALLFLIALLPNFSVVYRKFLPAGFYDAVRLSSIFITAVLALLAIIRKRIGVPVVATCILFLPLLFSSVMNDAEIMADVRRCLKIVAYVFVLNTMLYELGSRRFISVWTFVFEFLLCANLLAMLLYPNGLYHTENYGMAEAGVLNYGGYVRTASSRVGWLLGHQTGLCRYLLPAYMFFVLDYYQNKKIVKLLLFVGIGIAEVVISRSATNYFLVALFFIIIIYGKLNKDYHGMKITYVLILVVVFYFVYMLTNRNIFFSELLGRLLGRTVSISERSIIWERALSAIINRPLLGIGYYSESSYKVWQILDVANTHSQYFHFMFQGGCLALATFLWYLLFMTKWLATDRTNPSIQVIFAAMAALLIGMITDDYLLRDGFDFIVFFVCYYAIPITKQPQIT